MADPIFAEARLARLYDTFDDDRGDLDAYVGIVEEFGADSILDIGCGTGALACRLAELGRRVVGLDPADASLDVARARDASKQVTWIHGEVAALPPALHFDLVLMTGNVAQVFLDDAQWVALLARVFSGLNPGGRLVFETRDPAAKGWEAWTPASSYAEKATPSEGTVARWVELTETSDLPRTVGFRWTWRFGSNDEALVSDSLLRFRSRDEVMKSLQDNGFVTDEIRDAPDRPGLEMVFVARRPRGDGG